MRRYRTSAHSKHDVKVHIVFLPKYRKKVLTGYLGERVRDLIRQICSEMDVEIISGKLTIDHVHLFLSYQPYLSISDMVQKIKGKSSYKIMSMFPEVRKIFWGRHFWARGYLAVSSGNITDAMIKEYIEEQQGEDIVQGEIKVKS